MHRIYEQEAQKVDKLANDLHAIIRLINRCWQIANETPATEGCVKLVPAGTINDVKLAFQETTSELHQLQVICEHAVIYPDIDPVMPALRREQILDAMLAMNGKQPVFFKLSTDQQLLVGNELMNLIKARAGNLENAVEFAEGKAKLAELGLLDDAVALLEKNLGGPIPLPFPKRKRLKALPEPVNT